jgi:uncharacterized membrane protein
MDSTLPLTPQAIRSMDETETRKELRRLAIFLDSQFELPFGWRIGWDGIIGLLPVVGDTITNILSFYILYKGAMIGCPPSVVLRMGLNVLIDNLVDTVPIFGNIFDFMWKSNLKNVDLLESYLSQPHKTVVTSRAVVIGTILFVIAVMIVCLFLTFILARWLWGLFQPLW